MKQTLGNLERQLFAYAQMRGLRTLRTGDLTKAIGISRKQESKLFTRLSNGRMIAQVRRGLYLIPQRLPLGGIWTPNEILALNTLIGEQKGRYQICGPNAFNRYGYDEQVPNRVYAYNNRLFGERMIGPVQFTLIKVADRRLGSTEETKTSDGETGVYSSRARTLLDGIYDWSRFGSLPRAYEWVRSDLKKKRVTDRELVQVTLTYGDVGTIRRVGYLLERESVDAALLRKLERALKPTRSFIPWIPSKPKRGTINRRWGVVDNDARDGMDLHYHRDANLFTEAIAFTAARFGFVPALIEKDYFCSVVLAYLSGASHTLVFKGGTCLTKVHTGFYRLSEDLGFAIPMAVDARRVDRSRAIGSVKQVLTDLYHALPDLHEEEALTGANSSMQYIGTLSYESLLQHRRETIKIEISLREPLLQSAMLHDAATILMNPLSQHALVPPVPFTCITKREAFAEKFRAAMTRREPAIRDYFDIDYAVGERRNRSERRVLVANGAGKTSYAWQ